MWRVARLCGVRMCGVGGVGAVGVIYDVHVHVRVVVPFERKEQGGGKGEGYV